MPRKSRLIVAGLVLCMPLGFSACLQLADAPDASPPGPVKVSQVSDAYKVEPNIPYDKYPQTVLDILYPKPTPPTATSPALMKRPGVVMFHGGNWYRFDKSSMNAFYNPFLAHGFVVCNVEFRQATKSGGNIAPAALQDALTATKWFYDHAAQYNVDPSKIVVTGASSGALLATMVGMCPPEAHFGPTSPADFKIAAIINGYGPTDLLPLLRPMGKMTLTGSNNPSAQSHTVDAAAFDAQTSPAFADLWLPPSMPNRDDLARRLSPISYVRKGLPPILTIQGSRDLSVPLAQSERFTKALQAAGDDAKLYVVDRGYHGFTMDRWPEVSFEIFDTFLAHEGIIKPTGATRPAAYRGVPPYN